MRFECKWGETHDGTVQCLYKIEGTNNRFLIRQEREFSWMAINLTCGKLGVGQIFANGQSDIDCLKKAEKVLEDILSGE